MLHRFFSLLILSLSLLLGYTHAQAGSVELTPEQALGKALFFDTSLSSPPGQSCASCHSPAHAFTDPDAHIPVSQGVHEDRFGRRNTPSVAYAAFSPAFHYNEEEELYMGGQFLDGRSATLEEQALDPFVDAVEMNNRDLAEVVAKVRKAPYAGQFDSLYGKGALDEYEQATGLIGRALAAYERSKEVSPFDSKYDFYLAGKVELSPHEKRGLELFEAEDKGNCAACHPSRPAADGTPPLFTDFTYDNLGVPRNPGNPYYTQSRAYNPHGPDHVDRGLAETVGKDSEAGKFKVTTLRNIALTAPYMHNGVFDSLKEVVEFYNSRDVDSRWGPPEVAETVNKEELGDLKLSPQDVADIVTFMRTLTDGYDPNH